MGVSFGRWAATATMALALGCGGQPSNRLSENAVPIGVTIKEAVAKSNHSEVIGQVERARDFYQSRIISEKDLKLFVRMGEMAHDNQWNDLKKVVEEALGER